MEGPAEAAAAKAGKNSRKKKISPEKEKTTNKKKPGIPLWKMNLIYESELSRTKRLFKKKVYNASVKLKNLQKIQQTPTSNVAQILPNIDVDTPVSIVVKVIVNQFYWWLH